MGKNTTTKQAVNAFLAVTRLIETDKKDKLKLPAVARFRLASILRASRGVYEDYILAKNSLIESYGDVFPGSDGKFYVTGVNRDDFNEKNTKLLDCEVEVSIVPIPISELGSAELDIELIAELQDAGVIE